MEYDVFISYSRKDTKVADRICVALDQQGISYFIDRKGIGGGMEFPAVLADAIMNSKIMLFLGSENSYKSKFTNSEVTFAFNEKPMGSIIPYIIDGSTLPQALRFTFSSINIRTLEEHPIETTLMQDLCQILSRTYVDKEKERMLEEQRKQEEQRKEEERIKAEEARKKAEERKKKLRKNIDEYSGCLMFLLPLAFLCLGIWAGMKYHSFWLGTEIFLVFGWFSFAASMALSDWVCNNKKEAHSTLALGLLSFVIIIGIHAGVYYSSWWKGIGIGLVLLILDAIYFSRNTD